MPINIYKSIIIISLFFFTLNSCGKIGGVDAKKFPPDPKQRVKNNLEQGKGL
jgi:predicted small lipoprotein YifL